jgi:hypothetical protein
VILRSALLSSLTLVGVACARGRNSTDTLAADTVASVPAAEALAPSATDTSRPQATAGDAVPARPGTTPPASTPARAGSGAPATPPASPTGSQPAAGADTARGIVAVVGSTPMTRVVLRPPVGPSITLAGPLAGEIGVASGADVWVRGRRAGERSFEVSGYAVRAVDGVSAVTGTLAADGDRLFVVSDDGRRHTIARPPAPLREHVGARVWVSGDLSGAITAYGILRRR